VAFPTDLDLDELEGMFLPDDPAVQDRRQGAVQAQIDEATADLAEKQNEIAAREETLRSLRERNRSREQSRSHAAGEFHQKWQDENTRIQTEHALFAVQIGSLASMAAQFHHRFARGKPVPETLADDLVGSVNQFLETENGPDWLEEQLNLLLNTAVTVYSTFLRSLFLRSSFRRLQSHHLPTLVVKPL
jgi:hypothetical protein